MSSQPNDESLKASKETPRQTLEGNMNVVCKGEQWPDTKTDLSLASSGNSSLSSRGGWVTKASTYIFENKKHLMKWNFQATILFDSSQNRYEICMKTLIYYCLLHLSYENNGLVSHCMCITNVCLDHLIFEVNAITVRQLLIMLTESKGFLTPAWSSCN